ncbi:MAG: FAD:protein FMN transferase [Chloroflexi bacterium]|nr:FAD:protein FMN transferase [Chloroflexota bacterium]
MHFRAMNTDVELRVKPLPGLARAADLALHRAEISVRSAERRLSRFDPDSELSAINRGGAVRVSPLTFEVVRGALEAANADGRRL